MSNDDYANLVREITIAVIKQESPHIVDLENKINQFPIDNVRSVLKEQLTVLRHDLPEELNTKIDKILQHEYQQLKVCTVL